MSIQQRRPRAVITNLLTKRGPMAARSIKEHLPGRSLQQLSHYLWELHRAGVFVAGKPEWGSSFDQEYQLA